ncbi:MAG: ZIP family metal transporter [Candidatus Saccharibacteria bacterium]|nr:ZIP family metal transporter [Candidatus Saccharibacteria bacterium]
MNFILMLISVLLTAVLSISGGILLLYGKSKFVKFVQKIGPVIAFVVLIYAVFGDIVPEILEEDELEMPVLVGLIIAGFLAAALIGFIMGHFHHHNDIHKHRSKENEIETHGDKQIKNLSQAYTMLAVDSVHAIADGIVLGTSFIASPATGISACLATVAHEIPQEVGDFSIMQRAKIKKGTILKYQALSSLVSVPAAIVAYLVGNALLEALQTVLAIVAGFLLYVAFGELVCIFESIRQKLPRELK